MSRVLGTTAGGSILATLLAKGWIAVALAGVVVIVLTIAVCWVVADPDRPERLALLLTAWRGRPAPRRDTRGTRDRDRSRSRSRHQNT